MEKQSEEGKQKELDREASQNEQIRETGQAVLEEIPGSIKWSF